MSTKFKVADSEIYFRTLNYNDAYIAGDSHILALVGDELYPEIQSGLDELKVRIRPEQKWALFHC